MRVLPITSLIIIIIIFESEMIIFLRNKYNLPHFTPIFKKSTLFQASKIGTAP